MGSSIKNARPIKQTISRDLDMETRLSLESLKNKGFWKLLKSSKVLDNCESFGGGNWVIDYSPSFAANNR